MASRRPLPRFAPASPAIAGMLEFCLACLLFLACPASFAQQLTQYSHRAWRLQEGVLDAAPLSIAQTTDGFLWIGTLNGLARFDGVHFESWNDRIQELHTCCALSLLGSSDGSLWIGTSVGLVRLRDGKLVAITDHDGRYNAMIEDKQGSIWAARSRIRDRKGPLCEVRGSQVQCHGPDDGLGCRNGNVLAEDNTGTVWVGDEGKVCSWSNGAAAMYSAPVADMACKPPIQSLLADPRAPMLVGCEGGLRRIERGTLVPFRSASLDADNLEGAELLYDRGGGLWIGTKNHGLYHLSNGVADHFGVADGLSDDNVSGLLEDREGNVWVITPNGIDRFHRLSVISFSSKQGFSGVGSSAVLASRDGHTLWISSPQGLAVLRDGKVTVITRKQGLPGEQVTALFEDPQGVLWMGIDHDLFSYSNGRFSKKVRSDGKPTDMVVAMAEDANRSIWIVTAGTDRLLRLNPRTGAAEVVPTSLSPTRITSGPNGTVYLISFLSGEISILRHGQAWEDVRLATGPRTARSLLAYDEDTVFVATDAGLYRWKSKRWSALTTKNGLPCEGVQDLINDNDGGLWLHLTCGFVPIKKSELDAWSRDTTVHLDLQLYDAFDGARPGRGNFEPGHARTANGQLWFANGSVIQMIDPQNLVRNELPPPVHVLRVIADHRTVGKMSNIRLPALTRDVEIDYAALSLVSPEEVRFRYALWGADKEWQDAGSRREAYYMNLRPGNYKFQVIASNNDGVWNQQGATLSFFIAPAYYQTNWFRALCAATFLAFLWAAYQLRVRRLQRQFEMTLEARVGERTRIARELHDTLLQSAHGMLLRFQTVSHLLPDRPAEAKEKLDSAIDQTAEFVTEARDEVQGLRESTVQGNDLAQAISTLGAELSSGSTNHPPKVRVAVEGEARDLHPIVRDEIFKIAAEALRNAFLHAGAHHVEVEIRYDGEQFRLRVRDDGKGIDPAVLTGQAGDGHYGLPGMRERATLIGGNLTIWSEVKAGAELELRVPATKAYRAPRGTSWFSRKFAAKG